jgi:hypothetical protein
MRPRDIALVSAVLLVGGFAAADALHQEPAPSRSPTVRPTSSPTTNREPEPIRIETVRGARRGILSGRLLFSDEACRVHELDLRRGRLSPYAPMQSTCSITAPPGGARPLAALALPSPRRDVLPFRVVDLAARDPDVVSFQARTRSVVWSPDGGRVAWCEPAGRGQELELGAQPSTLPGCPAAYTQDGRPAYVRGRRVLGESGRTLFVAPAAVDALEFAPDGSVAAAVGGDLLIVYTPRENGSFREERRAALPPGLRHLRTVFSPTSCHAALLSGNFPPSPTVFVVDLRPCAESVAPATFSGRAAAWSPDGRWLAVAERRRVVVQPLFENQPAVALRIRATDLSWRP